jgi:hypothetical protein
MTVTPEERDLIIMQRNAILSNMGVFYPNARTGESYYSMMWTPFPDYSRRYAIRDFTYLEAKGYIERRAVGRRGPEPGQIWHEAYWRLTTAGLEIVQQLKTDPALEV